MKLPKSAILIEDQPEATCEACGRLAELRPYGAKREDGGRLSVCFECAMENEAEALCAFAERLGGENSVGRDFAIGEAMRTVETRCTACGRDISAATQIMDHDEAAAAAAEEGSVAVCQYCGHVMVMEEGGALRDPTSEEMADIAGDPRVTAFNDVREKLAQEAEKQPNPPPEREQALLKSLPPSPRRIARLPLDRRGYPVPYFVEWVKDGRPAPAGSEGAEPDFRVISERKRVHCFRRGICWTCGEPLGVHRVYPIGPTCAVNRTTMEPASHRDCAEYAVKACPFLARPRMRRLPKDDMGVEFHVAGVMIERNPGVTCLWETRDARAFDAGAQVSRLFLPGHGGHDWLIRLGEPDEVDWWREGRKATRDEVIEAIESGMPALAEIAFDQGADAMGELNRLAKDAARFLPLDGLPRP